MSRNLSTSSKSSVQESEGLAKVVFTGDDLADIALVSGVTPFDDLCSAEERALLTGAMSEQERDIRVAAISGLLAFLFKPVNGGVTPWESGVRLWLLAYCIAPHLIGGISLEKMGKFFGSSKQVLSKRMLKQASALNVQSRNSKSASAVESYRESTTEWHRQKKEEERREARRLYNLAYKAARREALAAYNQSYYTKNKDRILRTQRVRRNRNNQ